MNRVALMLSRTAAYVFQNGIAGPHLYVGIRSGSMLSIDGLLWLTLRTGGVHRATVLLHN